MTSVQETQSAIQAIAGNLRQVILGKDDRVDLLLAALLAEGHVLIEDLPGLGKTTLAKALALSIRGEFRRVQFTPDLLPSDVLGGSVYNALQGTFHFQKGPIFTNILLADEINRASARTQSSLLEAMAERQATIEGVGHRLPDLFMVIATQNPIEFHGTYPLPEAQLDRFLIRLDLGYTDADTEEQMLYDQQIGHPISQLAPVADCAQIQQLQKVCRQVHVDRAIGRYMVDLARATRQHEQVQMGAGPRGALGLFRMSQARAMLLGRNHVLPEDVQRIAQPVLAHRLVLETRARYAGADKSQVVRDVLASVPVPR